MQVYRTTDEAVIEMSALEREQVRSQLATARRGDRFSLVAGMKIRQWEHWKPVRSVAIRVAHGRGFNAYWESEDSLCVNVGEDALGPFSEAFNFPPGAHVHYDPEAFAEERNDTSVELIIQDERSAP